VGSNPGTNTGWNASEAIALKKKKKER